MQAAAKELSIVNIGEFGVTTEASKFKQKEILDTNKAIVADKGKHKDWQLREQALVAMQEVFEAVSPSLLKENSDFIIECFNILKQCLEENNIQIYLSAVQVASVFLAKTLFFEEIHESLSSMVKPVVFRTTDTNTRVRKKSIDLILQIWDHNPSTGKAA